MTDLTTNALNVNRTQNHFYELTARGLRPNTKVAINIDGVDHGYATKQRGKDFGADLISDENGILQYGVLYEVAYARDMNFELPQGQTLSFQDSVNNSGDTGSRQSNRIIVNNKIIELISPDGQSYSQFIRALNIILTAGSVRTLYPIE